jgi:predicted dehydrogenase
MYATAAAVAAGAMSPSLGLAASKDGGAKSPNEKLIGAVIGVNGRGGEHIKEWTKSKNNVELAYICDIDTKVGNKRCDEIAESTGRRPKYVQDLRKLFDEKSLDFVSIATPNHWHSLAAIWAMMAGKDVYVEKPVSHNVSEGRRDVQVAAKHKRICQVGTQSRSSPSLHEAIAYMKAGKIGEVKLARGLCYKPRGSIGPKGLYQPPKEVNYDLWSGPAQIKPLTRPKFHYDWHWQWDYGNGDIGNQGVHQMDIARWGLGIDGVASSVITYGGRFGYEDAGETPNTEVTILEFGDKTLAFEVRGLKTPELLGAAVGVIFYGTEGYVVMPTYSSATAFDLKGNAIKKFNGGGDHFGNFLSAVRTRSPEHLNAAVLEGHLSAALCHLGNISYRLGDLHTAGETADRLKEIKTHEKMQETLDRTIGHLSDNHVKLGGDVKFRVGPQLQFDPQAESFVGSDAANAFLTRDYRAPYIVPTADQV